MRHGNYPKRDSTGVGPSARTLMFITKIPNRVSGREPLTKSRQRCRSCPSPPPLDHPLSRVMTRTIGTAARAINLITSEEVCRPSCSHMRQLRSQAKTLLSTTWCPSGHTGTVVGGIYARRCLCYGSI